MKAVNGFTGQVTLGCSSQAGSGITCSFSPATVPTSGLSTLTVTTTARTAAIRSTSVVEAGLGAGAAAGLLVLLLPAARRRRVRVLAMAALVVLGTTLGCTELSNPPAGSGLGSGTPAGTQVITVTASGTDGTTSVQHNYTLSVNVQ